MKVAILEYDHFQYGLTISELFKGHEKIFFTPARIETEMREYNSVLCDGTFYETPTLAISKDTIVTVCMNEKIDLLFINPIFDSFPETLEIIKKIPCKKIITIHNLNYWLNPYYRSPKGWLEKKTKKTIVSLCDYIAVEDFMFEYIKNERPKLFNKFRFLNIPFTLFHPNNQAPPNVELGERNLRVVLTGSIHKDRRDYSEILEIIHEFANEKQAISFSFAGKAIGEYGLNVIEKLKAANEILPGIADYFDPNKESTPEQFRHEMENADLVLSTSTTEFRAFGRIEYIGKTKPTAAIQDMLSFQLPGLLPKHLKVPKNLEGSVFNYQNKSELKSLLLNLINQAELLLKWKEKAQENSLNYTATEISKTLPFF